MHCDIKYKCLRGIIQWQYDGLQNRSWGFESLFPWLFYVFLSAEDICRVSYRIHADKSNAIHFTKIL